MDIDSCARDNTQSWADAADDAVADEPALNPFRSACRSTLMGTNVTASKLRAFLEHDQLMSTFRYLSVTGVPDPDKMYDSDLGQRRLAFEVAIGADRSVVYGTLDLPEAVGDARYGPYRVVCDPSGDAQPATVLPHNSANGYGGPSAGTIDPGAVCEDVARWDDRADLATARFAAQAAQSTPEEWPMLLATEDDVSAVDYDLIEVVRRESPNFGTVSTVRISDEDAHNLAARYASALAANRVDAEVVAFGKLTERVDQGTLRLEVVG